MTPSEQVPSVSERATLAEAWNRGVKDVLEKVRATPGGKEVLNYAQLWGLHTPPEFALPVSERESETQRREVERLRGWPDIAVGAESPPHSPVDSYRCENEDCPSAYEIWQFRPDDYDLDEGAVLCPACGEEGVLFFRRFRGGVSYPDAPGVTYRAPWPVPDPDTGALSPSTSHESDA